MLRNPTNSSWQTQPAAIMGTFNVSSMTSIIQVGVWISALISIPGEAGFLTRTAPGEPPTDSQPRQPDHKSQVLRVILLPKTFPRGQAASRCAKSAGLVQGQLGGLRLTVRIVHWPIVVEAFVNPTMRPDFPVLCRAVSQIVGDISSVSIQEILYRHLEAVVKRRCVGRACPLCRVRESSTCSELPPRTHLHHRRRELHRSMCCRIGTASPTSGGSELEPEIRRKVRRRATSPSPAIRRFFGVQLLCKCAHGELSQESMQKNCSWGTARRSCPRKSICQLCNLVSSAFLAAEGHALEHEPDFLARSWTSKLNLGALCCHSSPLLTMSIRPSASKKEVPHFGCRGRKAWSEDVGGRMHRSAIAAVTPVGAALGWLQGNSSRSSEGRVLGPRSGWLQRMVAQ